MKSCTKRILAVLLIAVMALSLLAGCGGKKGGTDSTTPDSSSPSTETPSTPSTPSNPDHPNWLCDEKTTLTITTYDGVSANYPPHSNDDPEQMWQWLEEETNVHIEWEIIPYAGYREVIQTRLASASDLSDIIVLDSVETARQAGDNGILMDLAPYWDTNFPYTKAYNDTQNPAYKSLVTTGTGEIYSINAVYEPIEGHIVLMYNTAWMDKLGLEVPKTLDDFNKVLETMKNAGDLNGNGKDDEVILTSSNISCLNAILGNAYGLEAYIDHWSSYQVDDSGKVWFEDTSDNMKALLGWENDLYDKGILDAEIASMTADKLSEKIAADRVGVFVYFSSFAINYGKLTTAGQADPNGEHYSLGFPLASKWNNNEPYFVQWDAASYNPTGINAESENAELAMRWLDFLFSSEAAIIRRTHGVEGEDYITKPDGTREQILPTDGSTWAGSGPGNGQLTLPYQQTAFQLLCKKYSTPWYLDQYDVLREECEFKKSTVPVLNYYTVEEQEIIDTYRADFKSYMDEMKAKFITGEEDVEIGWSDFVKNAEKLGLRELDKAFQSVYDRTR